MVTIDLITGFLGSGKTTFIKKYAAWLIAQGKNICILENDFGAVNIDMLMLQDIMGEQCDLEMVSGGCDKDCHRRRFKTKLIAMGMSGYDHVIVEPSGIFDVNEFFDALRDEPLCQWYRIGSVIAVADAGLEDLPPHADYVLASEIADAGCVVLSKTDGVSEVQKEHTLQHINRALTQIRCKRQLTEADVVDCSWDALTDEDWQRIGSAGYHAEAWQRLEQDAEDLFSTVTVLNHQLGREQLEKAAAAIFTDPACGQAYRMKGFLQENGQWTELNATVKNCTVTTAERGQEVVIVIGENLKKEAIAAHLGNQGILA